MKIKSIELVLENCEVFKFDIKDITVKLEGVGLSIWGESIQLNTVEHAFVIVNKEAKAKGNWDNDDWAKRIHKDITQIHINYDNGSSIGYHLDWDTDSEYENPYETDIDKGDVMYYIISRTKRNPRDF